MQISFAAPSADPAGTIVVGGSDKDLLPAASALDKRLNGALRRAAGASRFKGKAGQFVELLAPAGMKAARVVLAGVGQPDKFGAPQAERLAAGVVGRLLTSGERDLTFESDAPKGAKVKAAELAAHLAMGAQLRSYSFHKYRTKQREEHEPTLANLVIGTDD